MIRLAWLAGLLALTNGCSDSCTDTIVSRSRSPDGRHDAVLYGRDCGATTGFSTQISVLDAGEQPTGSGNAFRADTDHGVGRAGDWGGPWAQAEWLSADQLLVTYAARSRLFEQVQVVSGVHVSYQDAGR